MFTVTTVSGFKMILEDAGRDEDGNQLWKQLKVGIGSDWKRREAENVQRLKLVDP